MAVYAASKAVLRSLARTLSAELKGCGIRVTAVVQRARSPQLLRMVGRY